MNKRQTIESSLEAGIVAVVRIDTSKQLLQVAKRISVGGISCIEITMTTPGALQAIEEAKGKLDGVVIGAGTVLDASTARLTILAGAQFLVTPTVALDVIEMAHRYGKVVIAGAMTPTEILTAWEAGADMVKVFPANVLGPGYLKAVHGPLPQIPLVPTGGITADNAGEFIKAGAAVICAGSWLVDKKTITEERYEILTERARELVDAVSKARGEIAR